MYWQKQFQQEDPDLALKAIIDAIREDHPNYGYRRILAVLRNRGIVVNKKKLQRIIQKFKLFVIIIIFLTGIYWIFYKITNNRV